MTTSIGQETVRGDDLGSGAAGTALLRVQQAHAGTADRQELQRAIAAMTGRGVAGHPDTASLYQGVPAVAFVLSTAGYVPVELEHQLDSITWHRIAQAHARIDRCEHAGLGEYDLISGLTGLAVPLLALGHHDVLRDLLSYLIRLTEPIRDRPGWWYADPPPDGDPEQFRGGHANFGLAHGINGPLTLLAIALREGITVPGHAEAIQRILSYLDRWELGTEHRWWPASINAHEHETGRTRQRGPQRPSWCYGTPGQVRAQQLAALALGDTTRQQHVENIVYGCVTDEWQLAQIIDESLCHGSAGLLHTLGRIAADSGDARLVGALTDLRERFRSSLSPEHVGHDGFLEGNSGIQLIDHIPPAGAVRWDACLLLG
ncbi:lanthionine synthetase C family protein [Sciscionella marina]|uniref:lanthionine synthetase C family protein n=1 Tax=Sciscionella marina TaxID=508770 RepID=UPI00039A204B|nr:lanthionine synthetase C family protein [Sciscionella marina]